MALQESTDLFDPAGGRLGDQDITKGADLSQPDSSAEFVENLLGPELTPYIYTGLMSVSIGVAVVDWIMGSRIKADRLDIALPNWSFDSSGRFYEEYLEQVKKLNGAEPPEETTLLSFKPPLTDPMDKSSPSKLEEKDYMYVQDEVKFAKVKGFGNHFPSLKVSDVEHIPVVNMSLTDIQKATLRKAMLGVITEDRNWTTMSYGLRDVRRLMVVRVYGYDMENFRGIHLTVYTQLFTAEYIVAYSSVLDFYESAKKILENCAVHQLQLVSHSDKVQLKNFNFTPEKLKAIIEQEIVKHGIQLCSEKPWDPDMVLVYKEIRNFDFSPEKVEGQIPECPESPYKYREVLRVMKKSLEGRAGYVIFFAEPSLKTPKTIFNGPKPYSEYHFFQTYAFDYTPVLKNYLVSIFSHFTQDHEAENISKLRDDIAEQLKRKGEDYINDHAAWKLKLSMPKKAEEQDQDLTTGTKLNETVEEEKKEQIEEEEKEEGKITVKPNNQPVVELDKEQQQELETKAKDVATEQLELNLYAIELEAKKQAELEALLNKTEKDWDLDQDKVTDLEQNVTLNEEDENDLEAEEDDLTKKKTNLKLEDEDEEKLEDSTQLEDHTQLQDETKLEDEEEEENKIVHKKEDELEEDQVKKQNQDEYDEDLEAIEDRKRHLLLSEKNASRKIDSGAKLLRF